MYKFLDKTNSDDIEIYNKYIANNPKGHFMQTLEWAKVKSDWKCEIVLSFDESNNLQGSMLVLIRKIPYLPYTIMYSPRGPVCDIYDENVQESLLNGAKELAKRYNSYVFKIDTDISSSDENYKKIVKKLGYKIKNTKDFTESIQPRYVFRLDVKNKTNDELIASFHEKTRYNIRLASRKGVEVRLGSKEDLKDFHDIMVTTGSRDHFVIRSLSYFQKMYDELVPCGMMRLYMAYYQGKPVSGSICIYFGNKVWYLYGASSNESRNVMPNYLIQWEMIKWATENKCDIYDFRGVSGNLDENHPQYGIYKFKKGFNGEFVEFIGELNYIFKPFAFLFCEKGISLFKDARSKVYSIIKRK